MYKCSGILESFLWQEAYLFSYNYPYCTSIIIIRSCLLELVITAYTHIHGKYFVIISNYYNLQASSSWPTYCRGKIKEYTVITDITVYYYMQYYIYAI
jgi:hypothetical protein